MPAKRSSGRSGSSDRPGSWREIREIKALLVLMQEYGLTELEIDDRKKGKVRLVRRGANEVISRAASVTTPPQRDVIPARQGAAGMATSRAGAAQPPLEENQWLVTSPMVGTFYRAPSPEAAPFVEEGSSVREGQTLCIIEAMKMMNEIEAEVAGRIVRILCENAQAVEYGQPLMVVEVREARGDKRIEEIRERR